MSPLMDLRKEIRLGRTEMSKRELGRVEVLAGRRSGGTAAPQRGTALEPRTRDEVSEEGAAVGAGEVRRGGGRTIRADAGGGTLGSGGRAENRCGDVAPLDVGGGIVESGAGKEAA